MKLKIFAKNVYGKKVVYLSRLVNKETGEVLPVEVRFRRTAGKPDFEDCPIVINVERESANLTYEEYYNKWNEKCQAAKLWISQYTVDDEYKDESLEDFDSFES